MDRYLYLDANEVKAEIGKLMAAYPELADDETLRADVIEGETSAFRIVERALTERREAETLALAIKEREAALATRRARFERKSEAMKKLIVTVMRAGKMNTAVLPEATLWLSKPGTSVGIENLDELPQGYFRMKREADKKAIKSALEQGEEIPGAFLVTGDIGLTVRAK
jgi:hypothetical protein